MKYCKLLDTGEVVELRMNLGDRVVIRHQDGTPENVPANTIEVLELADA